MKKFALILMMFIMMHIASAYTANFSNGFKIQDDALNNVFMVNKQGDVNFTGRMYGNGSGLTDLPASAVADAWVNVTGDTMTGDLNVNNKIILSTSGGNITSTGNFTLGEKIVFAFGEVVDNILDGWVRITGNLNVTGDALVNGNVNATGNVTANYIFGNGSQIKGISASNVEDVWVNTAGDTMTGSLNVNNKINLSSSGDLNVSGQALLGNHGSKVGIGTANPAYLLQVANGTNGAAVNLSGVLYINSTTGNVGIGTTSPGQKLDVIGSAYVQDVIYLGRQGVEKHLIFRNVYSTLATDSQAWSLSLRGDIGGANNDLKIIRFDNITGAYVDIPIQISQSTGNVGIGTATPASALHVVGNINVSGVYKAPNGTVSAPAYTFNDDTNTDFIKPHEDNISIVTDPSGNVGIGTTSPNGKLHTVGSVGGSIFWDGAVTSSESTIISDGTGDADQAVYIRYVARDTGNAANGNNDIFLITTPAADSTTVNSGWSTYQLAFKLYSTGQLTVSKTAGANNVNVAVWIIWV